ncbi:unnamed protein product, partial [Owenia fusiformis]
MTTRESFCYVDSNYYLAGVILEHLTGKPYIELVKERIHAPLNMNTSFPSRAKTYDPSFDKWSYSHVIINGTIVVNRQPWGREGDRTETLGAAAWGHMTTAEDMAEYMKFHLGAYRNDGSTNPVVDPAILREMYEPKESINFYTSFAEIDGLEDLQETWRVYDYGMGFWIGNYKDTDFIQHGGFGSHQTILTLFDDWNIGIYSSSNGPGGRSGGGLNGHTTMSFIHFYIADILRGNTPIYDIEYACQYTLPDKYGAYCGPFNIFPDY